jgi:hypothetical protein
MVSLLRAAGRRTIPADGFLIVQHPDLTPRQSTFMFERTTVIGHKLSFKRSSIWQRMFDTWVRSYEARVSADGKVFFIDL